MSWPKASPSWILQLSRMWGQGHSYIRCSRREGRGRKFPWAHTCCLKQQWIIKGRALELQHPVFPSSKERGGSSCGCWLLHSSHGSQQTSSLGSSWLQSPWPLVLQPQLSTASSQHQGLGHTRQFSYSGSAALVQQLSALPWPWGQADPPKAAAVLNKNGKSNRRPETTPHLQCLLDQWGVLGRKLHRKTGAWPLG